jgi:hypothetical protein
MKAMSRSEWRKTPYAASDARDPDKSIRDLLRKYAVADIQSTETTGPQGRPAFQVRFILRGKTYCVPVETLEADAGPDELLKQAKRAVYHMLKAMLEAAEVFWPAEQALFAFLEVPGGRGILYDAARPALQRLEAPTFGTLLAIPDKTPEQPR